MDSRNIFYYPFPTARDIDSTPFPTAVSISSKAASGNSTAIPGFSKMAR